MQGGGDMINMSALGEWSERLPVCVSVGCSPLLEAEFEQVSSLDTCSLLPQAYMRWLYDAFRTA